MTKTLLALSLSAAIFVPSIVLAGPCIISGHHIFSDRDVALQHCGQGNVVPVNGAYSKGYACKCPKGNY